MKITLFFVLVFLALSIGACKKEDEMKNRDQLKEEIMEVEKKFAALAKEEGLKIAFTHFAADDAVLNRGNKIIKGKNAIEEFYSDAKYETVSLQWKPDFVDVSSSGDMAYTYGKYEFSQIDEKGDTLKSSGIFHTVWKRQGSGDWRYVYD